MKNHAAILIGVNEYQNFSPLTYAKQDAQALENFLIEEGGFAPDRCLLMTPTSPPIESHSTYPNRPNLLKMIDDLCRHKLNSGDVLWFFFSGYAANYNGEDYLLPVDSTPADIANTGISIKEIFNLLRSSSAQQLLVLLDIKRPTGINTPIGDGTAKLARDLEIPTIISCKSRQTSTENPIVQHGFFTAALLEALRSNRNKTLENLGDYLSERLPQLCEENYSHRQDPLIAIAAEHSPRTLLPELNQAPLTSLGSVPIGLATASANTATAERSVGAPPQNSTPPQPVPVAAMNTSAPPPSTPKPAPQAPSKPQPPIWIAGLGVFLLLIFGLYRMMTLADYQARQAGTPAPVAIEPASAPPPPPKPTVAPTAAPPAVPIAPIASKPPSPAAKPTPPVAAKPPAAKPPAAKPPAAKPPAAPPKLTPSNTEKLQKPNLELQTAQAYQFSDAIAKARTIPKNDPLYPQAQKNIDRWSQVILDIAIGRAQQGAYQSAIKTANLVPKDRKETYATAQSYIPQWQKKSQLVRTNQQRLIEAQKLVRWGQASTYSKAIAAASQIKAGQPKYPEAKKLINQWSNNIWQIAQYRANRRLYSSAIAAAQLIPENTTAYPAAQKAIQQWQP